MDPDDGRAESSSEVEDATDRVGMRLAERAPEDGLVLFEDEDAAAIDATFAHEHAVTGRTVVDLARADVRPDPLEVPIIEQPVDQTRRLVEWSGCRRQSVLAGRRTIVRRPSSRA
jgi:hypothetical protein